MATAQLVDVTATQTSTLTLPVICETKNTASCPTNVNGALGELQEDVARALCLALFRLASATTYGPRICRAALAAARPTIRFRIHPRSDNDMT